MTHFDYDQFEQLLWELENRFCDDYAILTKVYDCPPVLVGGTVATLRAEQMKSGDIQLAGIRSGHSRLIPIIATLERELFGRS